MLQLLGGSSQFDKMRQFSGWVCQFVPRLAVVPIHLSAINQLVQKRSYGCRLRCTSASVFDLLRRPSGRVESVGCKVGNATSESHLCRDREYAHAFWFLSPRKLVDDTPQ